MKCDHCSDGKYKVIWERALGNRASLGVCWGRVSKTSSSGSKIWAKSAWSVINEVCSRDWEGSRVPRESVREENINMKVEEVRVKERACRPLWPQTDGNPLKCSRSFYSQHFWPQRRCFPSNSTSSTMWHQLDVQPFSSAWTLPEISTSSHRVKDFVPQCVSHHRHQLQVWAPLPSDWPATNGGFP